MVNLEGYVIIWFAKFTRLFRHVSARLSRFGEIYITIAFSPSFMMIKALDFLICGFVLAIYLQRPSYGICLRVFCVGIK